MPSNLFPLMPVPGIIASAAEEFPQNLAAVNQQPSISTFHYPGEGMVNEVVGTAKDISRFWAFVSNPARMVTLILGLMLIAAGLFSHPAVREKIVRAGKAAGKVAGEAALAA